MDEGFRRGEFRIVTTFSLILYVTKWYPAHCSVSRVTSERWLSTCTTQPTIAQGNLWQWRLWNKRMGMWRAGWRRLRSWSRFITATLSSTRAVVLNWVSPQLSSVCFRYVHWNWKKKSTCCVCSARSILSCSLQCSVDDSGNWFFIPAVFR